MQINQKIILALCVTVSIIFLLFMLQNGSIGLGLSVIIIFFLHTPLFLLFANLGIYFGVALVAITTLVLIFFTGLSINILFLLLYLLPCIAFGYFVNKDKIINTTTVISYTFIYSGILMIITNYIFLYSDTISMHDKLYDSIQMAAITISSMDLQIFGNTNTSEIQIQFFAMFAPSIIALIFGLIVYQNFRISYFIVQKYSHICKAQVVQNYNMPPLYNYVFILVGILSIFSHIFLDTWVNIYYNSYNVLFILWFIYSYAGIVYLFSYINKLHFLLQILAIVVFIALFFEILLLACMLGFLLSLEAIKTKSVN